MAIAAGTGHSVAAVTPARRVAVRLLRDQRVRDGRSRELLRSSDALSALDERDRALATRLVLGVVASRGALDAAIDSHLRPHSHLEPKVRDALRLASFELMYLDTPPSAAVSQGVELVRLASRRAAALANAILRRVAERDAPSAAAARARVVADDCSLEDLALTAALPIWLVRALVASRGESFARQLALSPIPLPSTSWATPPARTPRSRGPCCPPPALGRFRRACLRPSSSPTPLASPVRTWWEACAPFRRTSPPNSSR